MEVLLDRADSEAGTAGRVCRRDSLVCSHDCFTWCVYDFGLEKVEDLSLVFCIEKSSAISMSSF